MSGYSQRTTPYPDAPGEDYRRQTVSQRDVPGDSPLSWWRAWGERTFYLLVFIAFISLLVMGSALNW